MQNLKIYSLVHKRLVGEITEQELQELTSLELDPESLKSINEIEAIWSGSKDYFPQKSFDVDAAKARFKKKIQTTPNTVATSPTNSGWKTYLTALAIALGLAAVAYVINRQIAASAPKVETLQAQELEYAVLDDESKVWLQKGSTLAVTDFAASKMRQLTLTGEAYFEVAHDNDRPFVLSLGDDKVLEVLGTAFNVISDNGSGEARVDVKEGRVKLYPKGKPTMAVEVNAGESITYNPSSDKNEAQKVTLIQTVNGAYMSYQDTPLSRVFDDMKVAFGIAVDASDATLSDDCRFTSVLIDGTSLDNMVEILKANYPKLTLSLDAKKLSVKGDCK